MLLRPRQTTFVERTVAARGCTKGLDSHHDADRHRTWSAVVRGPQYFNPYYNNTTLPMCVQNKGTADHRGPFRGLTDEKIGGVRRKSSRNSRKGQEHEHSPVARY